MTKLETAHPKSVNLVDRSVCRVLRRVRSNACFYAISRRDLGFRQGMKFHVVQKRDGSARCELSTFESTMGAISRASFR